MPVIINKTAEPGKQPAKVKAGKSGGGDKGSRAGELSPAAAAVAIVIVLALVAAAYFFLMRPPTDGPDQPATAAVTSTPSGVVAADGSEDPRALKERSGPVMGGGAP